GWALQYRDSVSMEESRQAYEKSMRLAPDNVWYRKGVADALYRCGDEKAAREAFDTLIRDSTFASPQGDSDTLYLLGWCQYRQGLYDEAMRVFERVLHENDNIVFAYFDFVLPTLCSRREDLSLSES